MKIHSCDYMSRLRFYTANGESKDQRKTLFLGIEVEFEVDEDEGREVCADALGGLAESELLYLKNDGSLCWGIELVSHPMTLKAHREFDWEKVFRRIKSHGGEIKSTCGLHIHISRRPISNVDQIKLGYFIMSQRKMVSKIAGRTSSEFAQFVHKRIAKGQNRTSAKYEAISFRCIETIEFRVFKGTLDRDRLMAYLDFVHASVAFVRSRGCTSFLRQRETHRAFCDFIVEYRKEYRYLFEHSKKTLGIKHSKVQNKKRSNHVRNSV